MAAVVAWTVVAVCGSGLIAWRWWLAALREERVAQREAFGARLKTLEDRLAEAAEVAGRVGKLENAAAFSRR